MSHPFLYTAGAAVAVVLLYQVSPLLKSKSTKSAKTKSLKISEIFVYPIKSLRPVKLDSAIATKYGFQHDRTFMLLQATPDGYKNMAISRYPEMTQFLTSIHPSKAGKDIVKIDFIAFGNQEKAKSTHIPLSPNTDDLESFNVDMHGSPTAAFKMPDEHNAWFSSCFGYDVLLIYLGPHKRKVLWKDMIQTESASLLARIPLLSSAVPKTPEITFADCAPYLVVSSTSLDDVSSRLGPDEPMDVTKFRPNIVLSGAEDAWEEDFWAKLRLGNIELVMKHNCVRCASLNVDYATGKPGTGASGQVLKKLQKDRRVDSGTKWSPVFGRYAFWGPKGGECVLKVGDEAIVTEVNEERTVFNWPGLS
ncbi:hypothetical protein BU23DRAFT_522907 [Bimuria novae-zelandiae CBS 107.79]|uniref:MOSC domain-containing protein n=1 Tax=Bimuria novae-zelandiae CBS 107.79 TaxID=1447943 RepID=A0A6A5VXE9_9PLEO|nr:hypothetical protein BU23DRAFT_522907 [Bimuria novae-zelandiae CBS 107.79]